MTVGVGLRRVRLYQWNRCVYVTERRKGYGAEVRRGEVKVMDKACIAPVFGRVMSYSSWHAFQIRGIVLENPLRCATR
jgi:hypothetical protein